ncbi:MAG: tyrosine-type recombinase/integrase [Anaerolineales bacterium]|nr:tyrosine-type recombinase/integrase [Anaerolineales bacterium]
MNEKTSIPSAAAWYTAVLKNGRKAKLPPGYPQPQPPSSWPPENVALFERYLAWLIADGAGHTCITSYYLPVAGHVLGYHLQPHAQLNLDNDLERVMAFLRAKQVSERWLIMGRHALTRFRRFMWTERGFDAQPVTFKQANVAQYHDGLPAWLVEQLTQLQHIRQANWRPARLAQASLRFWSGYTRLWRWLFAHESVQAISDIKRAHLFAYLDEQLAAGYNPKSVNQELRAFQATLHFLQERGFAVSRTLLRLPGLKEPDSLPRFLTDEQVGRLQADLEQRGVQADTPSRQRNALLDRAAFYLLWQGGLRLGEAEELRLDDLNLAHKQLIIRQGKGCKDRAVYLTDKAVAALQAYLAVRGDGPTDHVFLYRHRPVCKDFLRGRIKAAGERAGVKVTPHQLRHTYATQLLNAGCKITTIQALLGHKHINTTLTYARVHDRTVAEDYFAAMAEVEKRLESHLPQPLLLESDPAERGLNPSQSKENVRQLLKLVAALQAEALNANQQALLAELRGNIEALTTPRTIPPHRQDWIVNVLPAQPLVGGLPPS